MQVLASMQDNKLFFQDNPPSTWGAPRLHYVAPWKNKIFEKKFKNKMEPKFYLNKSNKKDKKYMIEFINPSTINIY